MAEVEQRSEEWRAVRAGKITASQFADAINFMPGGEPYKSGPKKGQPRPPRSSAARDKLMRALAFERLSGQPVHEVSSKSMSHGKEVEDFAFEMYELETGNVVRRIGFAVHSDYSFIGASPDFLVDPDGGGEVKCPYDEAVHIATIINGMPEEHIAQVQGNMWVHGRCWWDFVSYDPRQAERFRFYRQRIERDDAYIKTLEAGLLQFEHDLRALIDRLMERAA
jgi:hypothetical protein